MTIGSVIVSLAGKKILPKERELLAHPKVGGLVLFRENYDENSPAAKADLMQLVKEIREINPNLLIMVDHEGGKVWRFNKGFNKLPSAKALGDHLVKLGYIDKGKTSKEIEEFLQQISDFGFLMARELLDCGIDLCLGAVVDLDGPSNVIGKLQRAYHSDPEMVAKIAESFIRGMNQAGMPATLKHYPGHGTCALDSHVAEPKDNRPFKELERDLLPFKLLAGKKDLLLGVMTAHVTYPQVDPNHTAGFSKIWIEDILRKQCGFQGAVMSDCLSMKGADIGTPDKRIIASQVAGCDFQMCTHQKGTDLDILLANLNKIPDNKVSEERREAFANLVQKKLKKDDMATTVRVAKAEASLAAFMAANAAVATATLSAATNVAAPGNLTTSTSATSVAATNTAAPMIIKGPQQPSTKSENKKDQASVINAHKK